MLKIWIGISAPLLFSLATSDAVAVDARSPLRGSWSFSQIVPSTNLLTGSPVPLVAAGVMEVDSAGQFVGHGVFNTPVPGLQTIELDLDGSCSARGGRSANGFDCSFNFPSFGLRDVHRYCVPMSRMQGRCYDELRCVNVDEPGETVALIEYRRQLPGTCE